eukprot:TRINITY_DN12967_c0_g1_i1.p2 TRINITY_DN12967_c0_g1~~TRINITY_DN12967_c0_g1_i1.p2  ORF type:complete len:153 (+),score=10.54 TRINITY_DN12967_c0_g1_i1:36-461(+)
MEAVRVTLCGSLISYCSFILLGAPFIAERQIVIETAAMSLWTGALLGIPLTLVLKTFHLDTWHRIFTSTSWQSKTERAAGLYAWATIFTMWISAIIIPLDWDVWYQRWPIPVFVGSLLGAFVGGIAAAVSLQFPGKWVKIA